jgi:gluconate 2-dehydrogenase gamma chain
MSDISRRNVFHIIGAVPAIAAVASAEAVHDHAHMAENAAAANTPFKRQTFDDHQWETIKVLCDLIIPADEKSGGATQAQVPEFLDDWLAFRAQQDGSLDLTATIFGGLMWLDREAQPSTFVALSADNQKKLLDRIAYPAKAAAEDHPFVAFFSALRSLTIEGYFSSKMGVEYLPYLGNKAIEEWKGCDPKVWSVIEDRLKNGYKGGVVPMTS